MKTIARSLTLASLVVASLTVGVSAQAQTTHGPIRNGLSATSTPSDHVRHESATTREKPDAALQRAITRARFNCLADYTTRQMEAIVYALTPEQLIIIARICDEQKDILQDYVDAQMIDGHQQGLFRYTVRAALGSSRAMYFKFTRAHNLRARAEYAQRAEQRRLDRARTTTQTTPSATALRAQEREAEYREIRRQRRSAN